MFNIKYKNIIIFLNISCLVSAQTTISLTGGKTLAAGDDSFIGVHTVGVDIGTSWVYNLKLGIGVRGNYTYIPNGIAGNRIGLEGFVTEPIARNFSLEVGAGLGFYTDPRFRTGDGLNKYIATTINGMVELGPVYDFGSFSTALKFVHNSNGFLAKPNVGLNYLQMELGLKYGRKKYVYSDLSYGNWMLIVAGGLSVLCSDELKPTYSIQTGYRYKYMDRRYLETSGDLSYNFSDYSGGIPVNVGIFLGNWTYFGNVAVRVGIGYDVVHSTSNKRIYERAGFYYDFGNTIIGVAIRANLARADFIEWTYGVDL